MRSCVLVAVIGLAWSLVAAPPITAHPFEPLAKADKSASGVHAAAPTALDCTAAQDVQLGDQVCGDNMGAPGNVDFYLGCTLWPSWPETGGEVVYRLVVAEPAYFEIRLESDCDLDLVILSECDADVGCLAVGDTGIRTTEAVSGEYFVVVDGYNGASCGFCLEFVEVIPRDPPFIDPAACATAQPVSCVPRTWNGTTCGAGNDVEYAGCSMFDAAGEDYWYELTLNPGGSVFATAVMPDADVALWLLDDCGSDFACVDYADRDITGGHESVEGYNYTGAPRTLFLVVDSYVDPAACAEFEVEIMYCPGGVVTTEATSWSTLKSTFVDPHGSERR